MITGVAGLFPQDLLQSSSALVLDLSGTSSLWFRLDRSPDSSNLDLRLNTSAGAYAAPVGFDQGAGTLDITWIPDARPRAGTMGSGKVIITFQGLINTSRARQSDLQVDFIAAKRGEGHLTRSRNMRFRQQAG